MKFNVLNMIDAYKLSHRQQYPEGTQRVYSNFTPRTSRIEGVDKVVFVGLQAFLTELHEAFQDFFAGDIDEICAEYEKNVTEIVGPNNVGSDHIRALHKLGFLPLAVKALPEGSLVPLRVPMFTIENTVDEFFWLVNYLETAISANIWLPCTSATQAHRLRRLLDHWALKTTGSTDGVEFQAHDFSYRGMAGTEAAAMSGAGHLLSFLGSDSLPSKDWAKKFYKAEEPVLLSVPATEHSVMCAGGEESEFETYDRLLEIYPSGLLSIVSDTWDLWEVVTSHLPKLKDKILAREGKVVIRPDSGNPADILCGLNTNSTITNVGPGIKEKSSWKGVVELLWEIFGGTINEQGYKVLDPHIGVIYGDSITYDRADDICRRLESKGFASTNVVFGVGSYTYQYVTRDTFGFAMKATNVVVNGEERPIFKDPKTDNSGKKSAKGRLAVVLNRHEDEVKLELIDEVKPEEYHNLEGFDWLQPVYTDGKFDFLYTWQEVKDNLAHSTQLTGE